MSVEAAEVAMEVVVEMSPGGQGKDLKRRSGRQQKQQQQLPQVGEKTTVKAGSSAKSRARTAGSAHVQVQVQTP